MMPAATPTTFDVPVLTHAPDFDNLLRVLDRKIPKKPTLFEFFLNEDLYTRLGGPRPEGGSSIEWLRWTLRAFAKAGYDYVTAHGSSFGFPAGPARNESSRSLNEGAVITDRASFEAYAWQNPDDCDCSVLDLIRPDLPNGMKVIAHGPGGVLENTISLVGFDTFCYMLMDDPALAGEIVDAVGSRLLRYYEICAAFDSVGACISNDDWGFKSQPMLSPTQLREFIFPWHKRIVAAIHAEGKPAILHSCGNAESIMDDIIDDMKFDGKHSCEDSIQPVEEAYEQYHARVAILGGIDVDFVCRHEPQELYERSRKMLTRSHDRGSYALGTGNSVPCYVPQESYLAMINAVL
jgi:uroporphyrinogen decarboxylase